MINSSSVTILLWVFFSLSQRHIIHDNTVFFFPSSSHVISLARNENTTMRICIHIHIKTTRKKKSRKRKKSFSWFNTKAWKFCVCTYVSYCIEPIFWIKFSTNDDLYNNNVLKRKKLKAYCSFNNIFSEFCALRLPYVSLSSFFIFS